MGSLQLSRFYQWKNNMKKLFIIFICAFLAACGTITKDQIVYKNTNTLIVPPDSLITDCTILPPPDKQTYLAASSKEKEKILGGYTRDLLDNFGACNARLGIIRKWISDQSKIYNTK